MRILARHIRGGKCPILGRNIRPDDNVPVQFDMDEGDKTTATVICGSCKKRLGKCKVKCSSQQGNSGTAQS